MSNPSMFAAAIAKIKPAAIAAYPLHGVFVNSDKPVTLRCRHAGFTNPGYTGVALTTGDARRKLLAIEDRHKRFEAEARYDAPAFAQHCIVGWDNVVDSEGKPIAMTAALVEQLLVDVIEGYLDLFVNFSNWINAAANFRDVAIGDPVTLGK